MPNAYYDGLESMRTGSDFLSEGYSDFEIYSEINKSECSLAFKQQINGKSPALMRKVAAVDDFDFS